MARVSNIEEETYTVISRDEKRDLHRKGMERHREALKSGSINRDADYGRNQLYKDERVAWKQLAHLKREMSITELQVETQALFKDERVMRVDPYPGDIVVVESSCKDGAVAYSYSRIIRYGTLRDNFTMYHEAAHVVGNYKHGREFKEAYVKLFTWFLGIDAGMILARNIGIHFQP
jgi:hypothetical protein